MTTLADKGGTAESLVHCPVRLDNTYLPLELALRDMRDANGRDAETGAGAGGPSWIGVCLGMIVLDTLSGTTEPAGKRFKKLLTDHDVNQDDASVIWTIRNALLHGYGIPKTSDVAGRDVLFTPDPHAYAIDTRSPGCVLFSVPVFCGHLVERIAAAVPEQWDTSLIAVNHDRIRTDIRLVPASPPTASGSNG
jgi:hypothetical protein